MAKSGIFATSKNTSAGAGFPSYVYVEWSASQDAILNRSTITWTCKVGSDYDNDKWVAIGPTTVTINGTATTIERKQGYKVTNKDCVLGSGTVVVNHETNGTKTAAVSLSSAVYSSSQNVSYSGSIVLDPIDRTAPVMTFEVSAVTVTGATLSAASTSVCDRWYYSTNGGSSWTQFSTTAGTTASITLTNLSPATSYNVMVRGRKKSNQVTGDSAAKTVKTLGGAEIASVMTYSPDGLSPGIAAALTVYQAFPIDVMLSYNDATLLTRTGLTTETGTYGLLIEPTSSEKNAIYAAMPNNAEITATLTVVSKDSGTTIQTSTAPMTIRLSAANSGPTFTNWTYFDSNSDTVAITGSMSVLVQGHSTLRATISSASANNGASIVKKTLQVGSATAEFNSNDVASLVNLDVSGTVEAVVTVIDSRGFAKSVSKNITFLPYTPPRCTVTTLRRANGVDADIQLVFSGKISTLTVSGTQKNSVTGAYYRTKTTDSTTWGSWKSITVTQSGENFSFSEMELTTLDPESSFNFELQIQDEFLDETQYDEIFVIPQGLMPVLIERGVITINGDLVVNGNLTINGDVVQNYLGILKGEGDADNCYVIGDSVPQTAKMYRWGTLALEGGLGVICHVSGRTTCQVLVNGVAQTLTSGNYEYLPSSNYTVEFEYTSSVSRIKITTN